MIRKKEFLILISASLIMFANAESKAQQAETAKLILRPFSSDGCSSFPDGTFDQKELWLSCCTQHDQAYWLGGEYRERLKADEELERCVKQVGETEIALLMLAGVRVGGSPFWITPYRWGYGWPYWDGWLPRGYKILSAEEEKQVEVLSRKLN